MVGDLDGIGEPERPGLPHRRDVLQGYDFGLLNAEDVGVEADVVLEDVHAPLDEDLLLPRAVVLVQEDLLFVDAELLFEELVRLAVTLHRHGPRGDGPGVQRRGAAD